MKLLYTAYLDIPDNSEVTDQKQLNIIKAVFDRAFDKVVDNANIFMEDEFAKRTDSELYELRSGTTITIKG